MTTQPQPDRMTAQELRDALRDIHEQLDGLRADLATLRDGLTAAAATQPAPASPGEQYRDFEATEILMSYDDKGNPTYKAKGAPYLKFGVRVWPEVLPSLGVDPASLRPGPNPVRIRVRALMGEQGPRKIIGLA